MNASEPRVATPDAEGTMRASLRAGMDREEAIQRMRVLGLNQIQCIKLIRDSLGISLGDAKEVVHYSRAWADRRESNEALHEAMIAAADEMGYVAGSEDGMRSGEL